jgi:hypothetical protein
MSKIDAKGRSENPRPCREIGGKLIIKKIIDLEEQ